MDYTLKHANRSGEVCAPASKSQAHRLLICAALGKKTVKIKCSDLSDDINATINCLNALCADITVSSDGIIAVSPRRKCDPLKLLYCSESGSTLRFLLPVCAALGENVCFIMEGRLSIRPMLELENLLTSHGAQIKRDGNKLYCSGKITGNRFSIPGNISSQYISGLLFALPLLNNNSTLKLTGNMESYSYVKMTEDALHTANVTFTKAGDTYTIPGSQVYDLPDLTEIEGDYSNAAFFLCMGALSERGVTVSNLSKDTLQGDRQILDILRRFGAYVLESKGSVTVKKGVLNAVEIDASQIPDLIPVISVVASVSSGTTVIKNAARLRMKESDRLSSTAQMLLNLSADVTQLEDGLIINGVQQLNGGCVDSSNDHRIAMSCAVAACVSKGDITVLNALCTNKSFPSFWERFNSLEV